MSILVPGFSFAQWSTSGNALSSTGKLGSTNSNAVSFITNNVERWNFSSSGTWKINALSGTGTGLFQLASDGTASRLNFSGNASDLLTGSGSFSSVSSLTGWSLSAGKVTTTVKVGIGVTNPVNKFEVDGSAAFTGTVYAEHFTVADASMVQGQLSFTGNMIMNGYDPIAGMKNEVYTTTQPYYLQSAALSNNNTIINYNNTGMVGIGTETPTAKLEVNGDFKVNGETFHTDKAHFYRILPLMGDSVVRFGDSSIYMALNNRIYWTPYTSGGILNYAGGLGIGNGFVQAKGNNSIAIGYASNCSSINSLVLGKWLSAPGGGDARYVIGTGVSNTQRLQNTVVDNSLVIGYNSNIPTFFIGPSSGIGTLGKVGVGTTTPDDILQVKTGYFGLTMGNALFADLAYGTSYLGFNAARTGAGTWKTDSDGVNNGGALMYSNVQGDLFFATIPRTGASGQTGISDATILSNVRLYINADGAVGIGTRCVPGGYKLGVDGKIMCEELHIKLSNSSGCWPDYVFDKDYKIMPIDDLEKYLDSEKHLPNVPSAENVEKEGINVSEMNKVMLEKIEELTLYIIELNKEIETLKTKVQNK